MNRFDLLKLIHKVFKNNLIICNIGLPSQELYQIKDQPNYFYMLGSMGLSSSIGLGLALSQNKDVISIDGDGSVLMNLNTLATIGNRTPNNFTLLLSALISPIAHLILLEPISSPTMMLESFIFDIGFIDFFPLQLSDCHNVDLNNYNL